MMKTKIEIAEIIKRLRLSKKMTQIELAEKLSVSDKTVSSWENAINVVPVDTLERIAVLFDKDLSIFVDVPKKPTQIFKIINLILGLSLIVFVFSFFGFKTNVKTLDYLLTHSGFSNIFWFSLIEIVCIFGYILLGILSIVFSKHKKLSLIKIIPIIIINTVSFLWHHVGYTLSYTNCFLVSVLFAIYVFESIEIAQQFRNTVSKITLISFVVASALLNISQALSLQSPIIVLCVVGLSEIKALFLLSFVLLLFVIAYFLLYLGLVNQIGLSLFITSFIKTKKAIKIILCIAIVAILFAGSLFFVFDLNLNGILIYSIIFSPGLSMCLARKRI